MLLKAMLKPAAIVFMLRVSLMWFIPMQQQYKLESCGNFKEKYYWGVQGLSWLEVWSGFSILLSILCPTKLEVNIHWWIRSSIYIKSTHKNLTGSRNEFVLSYALWQYFISLGFNNQKLSFNIWMCSHITQQKY